MNARNFAVEPHAEYHKVLTKETLSPNVKECQYAVRGAIPLRGEEIKKMLAAGSNDFDFKKTLPCNIGNP
jgi:alanine transaminase